MMRRKIYLTILLLFIAFWGSAQIDTMYIYLKNELVEISLNEIDSMRFNVSSETTLVIYKNDNSSLSYQTNLIDSIKFQKEKKILPIAMFVATPLTVIEGQTVSFTDNSENNPVSWLWNFEGGVPQNSTEQNPVVKYFNKGTYNVSLMVINKDGSNSILYEDYITVNEDNSTTVTDIDGNVYNIVVIGDQKWISENLKTTKLNDGTLLPDITHQNDWNDTYLNERAAYCWYNNDEVTYRNLYGALYNWYAVETGKLCPSGWHIPTFDDWNKLYLYVATHGGNWDGSSYEGTDPNYAKNKIAKALCSKTGWASSIDFKAPGNTTYPNNSSGFSAMPAGMRESIFKNQKYMTYFWKNDELSYMSGRSNTIHNVYQDVTIGGHAKDIGLSVRCLKNDVNLNLAPRIPKNPIPQTGYVNQPIHLKLQWKTTDVLGDNLTYKLFIDKVDGSTLYATKILNSYFEITELEYNTKYFWKIIVSDGTNEVEGPIWSFNTKPENTGTGVMDFDGNFYRTVTIGTQEWMAENLKTTHYNDGSEIPLINRDTAWLEDTKGAYSWIMQNEAKFKESAGALYNWYAVSTGNLCPEGWHVPSYSEWSVLKNFLTANGHSGTEGQALKSKIGWKNDITINDGTDDYGFSALPAWRFNVNNVEFDLGSSCYWWNSDGALTNNTDVFYINSSNTYLAVSSDFKKSEGIAVRCVKN